MDEDANQDINLLASRNSLMNSGRKTGKNEVVEAVKKTNNNFDIEGEGDDDDVYSNSDTVERKKRKELAKSS